MVQRFRPWQWSGSLAGVLLLALPLPALAEGDPNRGKRLFRDIHLSASTNDNSCDSCHERGEGLHEAASKQQFHYFFGFKKKSLEAVVNWCITGPLDGQTLATDAAEMRDLVAYIRSL